MWQLCVCPAHLVSYEIELAEVCEKYQKMDAPKKNIKK